MFNFGQETIHKEDAHKTTFESNCVERRTSGHLLHVRFFTATAPNALERPGEAVHFRAKPPPGCHGYFKLRLKTGSADVCSILHTKYYASIRRGTPATSLRGKENVSGKQSILALSPRN